MENTFVNHVIGKLRRDDVTYEIEKDSHLRDIAYKREPKLGFKLTFLLFRSLCNNDAYYRHTLSELHFKRTSMTGNSDILPKNVRTYKNDLANKQNKKLRKHKKGLKKNKMLLNHSSSSTRCPTCFANIPQGYHWGKHLISHFHHHRSLTSPNQNELILAHIEDIVKLAPFQCFCGFYFNFNKDFEQHFQEHEDDHGKTEFLLF